MHLVPYKKRMVVYSPCVGSLWCVIVVLLIMRSVAPRLRHRVVLACD